MRCVVSLRFGRLGPKCCVMPTQPLIDSDPALETHAAQLRQLSHPLAEHHLARLREASTDAAAFRASLRQLAALLGHEATRDLELASTQVRTPLATSEAQTLSQRVGIVPILRAGLGMVEPLLELMPEAEVWHLGVYRDESTWTPVEYYRRLPPARPVDVALVLDPMLATGGSAAAALAMLRQWEVPVVKLLSVIASREGIEAVQAQYPQTQIYVCAIDSELNEQRFIVPGLGDAGDRIFHT